MVQNSTFKFLALALLLASCNKDGVITEDVKQIPVIELDSETGIYSIKAGRELTIAPTYKNAGDALFAWTVDGKLISSDPVLKYTWEQEQELYVNLRVDNAEGFAEEELKVEVLELTPPLISFVIPSKGLKVIRDTEYTLAPDIQNDDLEGFGIEWVRDGKVVGTGKTYTFSEKALGTYPITINASNIDGTTTRQIDVEVVETMPYDVRFPAPSYTQTSTDRYTFAGRPVFLRPLLEYFDYPEYVWSVNGEPVAGATERVFKFTPDAPGEYNVTLTVSEGTSSGQRLSRNITRGKTSVTATVRVVCETKTEQERYRAATASSSKLWNQVYEFMPAPGQFVNEPNAGFTGDETTPAAAVEYATMRLQKKAYVSLGTFGGYIVVGFDHSIRNSGGEYDFAIQGNAFNSGAGGGSNEPGVVWVMQDTNGNRLPDDEWYELKGSETGKEETLQDYEVTYYKPDNNRTKINWTDSEGKSGWVDYLGSFHGQESYYPLWVTAKTYTLTGTCLSSRNNMDPVTGYWGNLAYDWGYADNMGSDNLTGETIDGSGQCNGFKISNAIYHDGTPVDLKYVDFIKVQCGVLAKSGQLGEISTEVFSFEDLSITK